MKRFLVAFVPIIASAQQPVTTSFVTTVGKDTFCLEQYSRKGNVITGTWVVMHPPGVYVHDYVITLGNDGLPTRFTMKYSVPSAPTPPELDSLTVVYGRDSANLMFYRRHETIARRLAIHGGFPLLGQSIVGIELALQRLRRLRVDSSTIALHPPSAPDGEVSLATVQFRGGDSAMVAGDVRVHTAPDGSILGLRWGARELRRVTPFDMSRLVAGFVKAFARPAGESGG